VSAAAVIIIRRRRLVRRFRAARAIDPEHAMTLESVGERPSWIFRQMMEHGAFVAAPGERYYMDERATAEFLRIRRVRALIFIEACLLLFLILWLCGVIK
jgi:hypothetical protein